jgi:hypothetical protein
MTRGYLRWIGVIYASSNRTCELGLQQATGRPYRSVVQALEERSRYQGGRPEADPD